MRCFHVVCFHRVVVINRPGAARPESAGEPTFAGGALVINWPARRFPATAMACSTLVQNSMYRPEGQPASCQSRRASRAISVRWSALLCCVGFSISLSLASYVLYDGSQRCSAGFQSAASRLSNPPARPIGGLGTPVGLPIRHRRPALKALGTRRLERCATLNTYLGRIAVVPQILFFYGLTLRVNVTVSPQPTIGRVSLSL